jgi:molybdate transport system ATP-binding protein
MSLELRGTIQRGDFRRTVDLTVTAGDVVAIQGVNGSGKSTVLHTIAGLTPLVDGSLIVDSASWDVPTTEAWITPESRECGVVFQDLRLFPHLTAVQNVAFGLRCRGVKRADALTQATQTLEQLHSGALSSRRPAQLSGGERQRVALARALVLQPRVLLLDEPFSAIDEDTRAELQRAVPALVKSAGTMAVLVTHDDAEASVMASRSLVLEP